MSNYRDILTERFQRNKSEAHAYHYPEGLFDSVRWGTLWGGNGPAPTEVEDLDYWVATYTDPYDYNLATQYDNEAVALGYHLETLAYKTIQPDFKHPLKAVLDAMVIADAFHNNLGAVDTYELLYPTNKVCELPRPCYYVPDGHGNWRPDYPNFIKLVNANEDRFYNVSVPVIYDNGTDGRSGYVRGKLGIGIPDGHGSVNIRWGSIETFTFNEHWMCDPWTDPDDAESDGWYPVDRTKFIDRLEHYLSMLRYGIITDVVLMF